MDGSGDMVGWMMFWFWATEGGVLNSVLKMTSSVVLQRKETPTEVKLMGPASVSACARMLAFSLSGTDTEST